MTTILLILVFSALFVNCRYKLEKSRIELFQLKNVLDAERERIRWQLDEINELRDGLREIANGATLTPAGVDRYQN
ncbi:MAG: hypothetical protein EOO61_05610 [Hymenobacter sp.]|nr:MAG: hypothetical protein EOO61_05610 [Hymenobacter sp.]